MHVYQENILFCLVGAQRRTNGVSADALLLPSTRALPATLPEPPPHPHPPPLRSEYGQYDIPTADVMINFKVWQRRLRAAALAGVFHQS